MIQKVYQFPDSSTAMVFSYCVIEKDGVEFTTSVNGDDCAIGVFFSDEATAEEIKAVTGLALLTVERPSNRLTNRRQRSVMSKARVMSGEEILSIGDHLIITRDTFGCRLSKPTISIAISKGTRVLVTEQLQPQIGLPSFLAAVLKLIKSEWRLTKVVMFVRPKGPLESLNFSSPFCWWEFAEN